MSWTLVAETENGWKKYRDNQNNAKYKNPSGHFSNVHRYTGGLANEDTEYEHSPYEAHSKDRQKVVELWGGSPPPEDKWNLRDVSDEFNYVKRGKNWERKFYPPIELRDFRNEFRANQLEDRTTNLENEYDFEVYFWSIRFEIQAQDGTNIGGGWRHTNNQEYRDLRQIRWEFLEILEEEMPKYYESGELVVIKEIRTCGRELEWE